MLLKLALLVPRGKLPEIVAAAEQAAAASVPLVVEPSGPWPPYHFCPSLGEPQPVKRLVHAVLRVGERGAQLSFLAGLSCLSRADPGVAFSEVRASKLLTPTVPGSKHSRGSWPSLHRKPCHNSLSLWLRWSRILDLLTLLARSSNPLGSPMLEHVDQCDEYTVYLPADAGSPTNKASSRPTSQRHSRLEPTERPGTNYLLARRDRTATASALRKRGLGRSRTGSLGRSRALSKLP